MSNNLLEQLHELVYLKNLKVLDCSHNNLAMLTDAARTAAAQGEVSEKKRKRKPNLCTKLHSSQS